MSPSATLFLNCSIFSHRDANAILVRDGIIEAVGLLDDLAGSGRSVASRVDLQGGFVVPGFNDCHMHVMGEGLNLNRIRLAPSLAPSIQSIVDLVRQKTAATPDDQWVLGRGYDQNQLAEKRHPTLHDLDPASGGLPVVLWHTSGHMVCVNSKALALAGVSNQTPDPPGGEIARDSSGRPTGLLKENAMGLVVKALPPPTVEQARAAIVAASRVLAADGITSASDAATGQYAGLGDELAAYVSALDSGELCTRLTLMPLAHDVIENGGIPSPHELTQMPHPDMLKLGALKIFSDGALTTRTAAVGDPYSDGGHGLLIWSEEDHRHLVQRGHDAGWQMATHAIGDRAIAASISAYEAAMQTNSRQDPRHRIEHCTLADKLHIERMAALQLMAILQPEDIAVLGDAYPPALGERRAAHNSPVNWFRSMGVRTAFSSDRPVTPGHPLVGIQAAVERTTAAGAVQGSEHRVTATEAIDLYTRAGSEATFDEHHIGLVEPGYAADFVILDRNITSCRGNEISSAQIMATYLSGVPIFER
jgi:predicted amidohydrolase YtcJ